MFMLPVPSWVHPAWMICAGLLSLVVARKVVGLRWTATVITATYLAYRAVMWLGLVAMGFPPSALPVVLIVRAVLVDVAVTGRSPDGWRGLVVTGAVYVVAFGQEASACCRVELVVGVLPLCSASPRSGPVDLLAGSRWFARWRTAEAPAARSNRRASDRGAPARAHRAFAGMT